MGDEGQAERPREIYEKDATGRVAAIYDDIKATLGYPVINMIYRRLAMDEDALAWCWEAAKPLAVDGSIEQAAARLSRGFTFACDPLTPSQASRAGSIVADRRPVILAAIEIYNRANPLNMVMLGALKTLRAKPPAAPSEAVADRRLPKGGEVESVPVPTMIPPEEMTPDVAETVRRMIRHREVDGLFAVPSIYRHLANWPDALALAAEILDPMLTDGRISAAAARLTGQAMDEGAKIAPAGPVRAAPGPGTPAGALIDGVIESFSQNIPELILVGHILRGVFARQ